MTVGWPATAHLFIINPFSGGGLLRLFSTRPPTEARVESLCVAGAAFGIALLVSGLAMLKGKTFGWHVALTDEIRPSGQGRA